MTLAARAIDAEETTGLWGLHGRRVAARLAFAHRGGRTVIAEQLTPHPFHITRTFAVPGDPAGMATLYLQSSSGGLYGGDDLSLDIAAGAGAAVHVTTQASTMVPAARLGVARHRVRIEAGAHSLVEYLPDPVILFDGAHADLALDIVAGPEARFVAADSILLHKPGGEGRPLARMANRITVSPPGSRPVYVDSQMAEGEALLSALTVPGADRPSAFGTLLVSGSADGAATAAAMQEALARIANGLPPTSLFVGVTRLDDKGLVIARYLAAGGALLMRCQKAAWAAARRALVPGSAPEVRRK